MSARSTRSGPPRVHSSRRKAIAAAAVAIAAFAAYVPALSGGFVFDDRHNVLQNPWVLEPGRLGEAFSRHMAAFSTRFDTSYYRPLMHVLLWGAHRLAGLEPWGYHLLLALLHAAASAAVFALISRVASRAGAGPAPGPEPVAGAAAGALLFALHPVHVEAVAWISGVVDLSYSALALLALLAAASDRAWARIGLAPPLFLLALLSKEPAAMLLPALGAMFLARGDLRDPGRRRADLGLGAGLLAAGAAYLALRASALGGLMGTGGAHRVAVGSGDGLLTAVALAGEYLRLLLAPVGLTAVHDFPLATGLADGRVWVGLLALAGIAALAWRWRRDAGAALGLSLVLLPLLPSLYVPVLGEGLVAERYLYLPSAGLALLVAIGWDAWPWRARGALAARGGIAAAVALGCAWGTVARQPAWHDDVSLWSDAVRKVPSSAAAHEYLGFALLDSGRPGEAIPELTRALDLDPERADARTNLAAALATAGRNAEAIAEAQRALAERPGSAELYGTLGYALAAQGRLPEAAEAYRRAAELDPALATAHSGLGIALARLGQEEAAAAELEEAVRLDPGNASYRRNLEMLRLRSAATSPR